MAQVVELRPVEAGCAAAGTGAEPFEPHDVAPEPIDLGRELRHHQNDVTHALLLGHEPTMRSAGHERTRVELLGVAQLVGVAGGVGELGDLTHGAALGQLRVARVTSMPAASSAATAASNDGLYFTCQPM